MHSIIKRVAICSATMSSIYLQISSAHPRLPTEKDDGCIGHKPSTQFPEFSVHASPYDADNLLAI